MAIQACASAVRLPEADDSYNLLLGNLKPDKKFSKSKMAISKKELIKLLKFSKVMIALLSFIFMTVISALSVSLNCQRILIYSLK